jgi:DNA recombination protein RmuC
MYGKGSRAFRRVPAIFDPGPSPAGIVCHQSLQLPSVSGKERTMNEALPWLILSAAVVNLVLIVIVLVRASKSSAGAAREVRDELRMSREEARNAGRELREEVSGGLKSTNEVLSKTLEGLGQLQHAQLEGMTKQLGEFTESNQRALDRIRLTFDARVKELQEGNEKKLDEMRKTVDEKLHDTLEKRLGESFKLVSDRLEAVHKGLGEMQHLATGVGDLKRVLTNVKARGTWAEVQLGAILEQILTPEQFEKNVRVKADSQESVEFAVRLPGPKDDPGACVWLPIDSKFPQEDYLRLQEAAERADPAAVQTATDALARTVRAAAKDIHDKYISPPSTTDFGIMFLATEGLYAEVLRQPALVEDLQHRYRVVVAGPTTLAAILSSLRMGFQTLAIEQRTAEVWRVLGATKTAFGKFGEVLDKVKHHIDMAGKTIDKTGARTRDIERRLRSVEQLPEPEALEILALPVAGEEDVEEEAPTEPK